MVFGEPVLLKAQESVDVLPVIEPAEARVPPPGLIALPVKVPHIGVHIVSELLILAVPSQEAPLRVHRAPGEDVGQQVAGDTLLLQGVPGSIYLLYVLLFGQSRKISEVAEGLQHDPHHADFFVLRDRLLGEALQGGGSHRLLIPLRRHRKHILHTVQEWIQDAVGDKDLGVRPGVDQLRPGSGAAVGRLVAVQGQKRRPHHRRRRQQSKDPDVPPAQPPGQQEQCQDKPQSRPAQSLLDQGRHVQRVVPHDPPRLGDQLQIAGQQGIPPQLDLEVVGQRHPQGRQGRQEIGQPAPAGEKIQQPDQQHRRQEIPVPQVHTAHVPHPQVLCRQVWAGHRRQGHGQPAQQQTQSRQAQSKPQVVPGQIGRGRPFGTAHDSVEMLQANASMLERSKIRVKSTRRSISQIYPEQKQENACFSNNFQLLLCILPGESLHSPPAQPGKSRWRAAVPRGAPGVYRARLDHLCSPHSSACSCSWQTAPLETSSPRR